MGERVNAAHESYHREIHRQFLQKLRAFTPEEQQIILTFLRGL